VNGITASSASSLGSAAGERFTSIARLRTIVAIQVIGMPRAGSKLAALRQMRMKASCTTSSARSRRRNTISAMPNSLRLVTS
jgi:hypothetical protein